ncbi:hypothetical protein HDU98_001679 [Podochytrium sp. JEL0797]|nr:hypothetical protein HDU98_001679 [Podochytrium sp. JEL0797]
MASTTFLINARSTWIRLRAGMKRSKPLRHRQGDTNKSNEKDHDAWGRGREADELMDVLQVMGLHGSNESVPVIPLTAFEIVHGAEDSEATEMEDERDSRSSYESGSGATTTRRGYQLGSESDNDDDEEEEEDAKSNKKSGAGVSSVQCEDSASAGGVASKHRSGSSATMSSWIMDQTLYDEAEVRSALPCSAVAWSDTWVSWDSMDNGDVGLICLVNALMEVMAQAGEKTVSVPLVRATGKRRVQKC